MKRKPPAWLPGALIGVAVLLILFVKGATPFVWLLLSAAATLPQLEKMCYTESIEPMEGARGLFSVGFLLNMREASPHL